MLSFTFLFPVALFVYFMCNEVVPLLLFSTQKNGEEEFNHKKRFYTAMLQYLR